MYWYKDDVICSDLRLSYILFPTTPIAQLAVQNYRFKKSREPPVELRRVARAMLQSDPAKVACSLAPSNHAY